MEITAVSAHNMNTDSKTDAVFDAERRLFLNLSGKK